MPLSRFVIQSSASRGHPRGRITAYPLSASVIVIANGTGVARRSQSPADRRTSCRAGCMATPPGRTDNQHITLAHPYSPMHQPNAPAVTFSQHTQGMLNTQLNCRTKDRVPAVCLSTQSARRYQGQCNIGPPDVSLATPRPSCTSPCLAQNAASAACQSPRPLPADATDFRGDHIAGHQHRPNSDIVRIQPLVVQPITATHERLTVSQLTNIR